MAVETHQFQRRQNKSNIRNYFERIDPFDLIWSQVLWEESLFIDFADIVKQGGGCSPIQPSLCMTQYKALSRVIIVTPCRDVLAYRQIILTCSEKKKLGSSKN